MFGNSRFNIYHNNGFKYLKISKGDSQTCNLVFLHGLFGGLSNFDPLIRFLDDCQVYVPKLPIHDFDDKELSLSSLTDWLEEFFNILDEQNFILVGNSMGGHLALNYVLTHPKKVEALVLTGSSGLQEKDFGSSCPRRNDREYIRKQAAQTFYDDIIDEQLLDSIMEVIRDPHKLQNILALTRDTHERRMEQFLPKITHPTLLVWGENDEITTPSVANKFHSLLPNSRLRWIEKCGHAPMMEHPETFALFLNEFLIELQNKQQKKNTTDYEENYSHF